MNHSSTGSSHRVSAATADLLRHFERAFADSTLSQQETRQLRQRLAEHGQHGTDLHELRHELFNLARSRFNSFQDKAVVEWLETASALLLPPAAPPARATRSEVHFSPGDECVAAIQRFIGQAAHQLDVCVFTVADDRLTDALLTAHRRGLQLRLLTDNDKVLDRGSDVRQLAEAGIPVRTDHSEYHMHHKFAVADCRTVLTGSYNWTRSAAEYNLENLVITDEHTIAQRYCQEFERLWPQMAVFKP